MRPLKRGCKLGRHHLRRRVIQYAEASRLKTAVSGILDRPDKPGDDD
jgi:hypothetical protein